jgi:glucan phosphoethanolaminetransferase (alkaline phosphatase superfamily)
MWQRKQTIFLGIAALSLILMIFFPIWRGEADDGLHSLFPLHYTVKKQDALHTLYFPYSVTAILAIAAATICIIEIGKFENRMLQLKLGLLNSLLMAGTMAAAVFLAMQTIKVAQVQGAYGYALYMPVVAMLCNTIANRFIRKDEKLVRDSDRLR